MSQSTRTVRTMCPMNCHPTLCGMLVEVQDGHVVGVKGDEDNPDSRGFLCVRGQASREIVGNPKRLLRPLMRDRRGGGAWREASWDETLDVIADRIGKAGREATALWIGHGSIANSYGPGVGGQLCARFANLYGCQYWSPAMVCWGLGGFGVGLTGALEINTKEDMAANAALILMWGANIVSQPNIARHLIAARRRGARIVTIDVRQTETVAQSDEFFAIRPGSDAALALAMMHVIIGEGLHDTAFIAGHTLGFDELAQHVGQFSPEWAAGETGIAAHRIASLARDYARTKPAMIVLGGSSLHKGRNGWQAARAVACLPALIGAYGIAGGGLGSRHGAHAHGGGFASVTASERRRPGRYVPNQMSEIAAALGDGRIRALLIFGSNMLSSYADTAQIATALDKLDLVVAHDLFMNETIRRFADVALPGTAWLEDIGCKATQTHLYLAERVLPPEGEARPMQDVLRGLAERLGVADFYPWASHEDLLDAILACPSTGRATVATLRAAGGILPLKVSHIAYPDRRFDTPSGKIEFVSARAAAAGLPALPMYDPQRPRDAHGYPLALCHGRTLTQFHAFYDHGQALPLLAERDPEPRLWMSPADAAARRLSEGDAIRIHNQRGEFSARAHVTERMPPGVVWMRDGWPGLNRVTSGAPVLPQAALGIFHFTVGQADYGAMVEVAAT